MTNPKNETTEAQRQNLFTHLLHLSALNGYSYDTARDTRYIYRYYTRVYDTLEIITNRQHGDRNA